MLRLWGLVDDKAYYFSGLHFLMGFVMRMMKAVVKSKPGLGCSVMEIPYPTLNPGWVIIKIKASGICGSDVAMVYLRPWEEVKRLFRPEQPYYVLGHEYVGEVVEVGEGVSDITVGDHVTVNPWYWSACGKCRSCRSYRPYDCRSPVPIRRIGGMAEYTSAPATFVHKLPNDLSWDDGALIEPFTITFAAVYDFSSFRVGKTAAILGPGPIGLLTLAALKLSTPSLSIVTGTSSDISPRLEIAKKLGADVTINVDEEDPVKRVMELTEGRGIEYVYEAAGVPLLSQGIKMLAKEREYTAIGHAHGADRPIKLSSSDYMMLQSKWAKINAMVLEKSSVWFTVIDLMKKRKIDLKPVITHHVSIDDAPEGFELMLTQKSVKIIINP